MSDYVHDDYDSDEYYTDDQIKLEDPYGKPSALKPEPVYDGKTDDDGDGENVVAEGKEGSENRCEKDGVENDE